MHHIHFNYLAVFVSAVVAFGLGAVWYSPLLFAKAWVHAHGFSDAQLAEMQKAAPRAYGISFVLFLVMAGVLTVFIQAMDLTTVPDGIHLGLHVWLGFCVTIGLMAALYTGRRISTFAIDAGYQLVYLLIMSVMLTMWR